MPESHAQQHPLYNNVQHPLRRYALSKVIDISKYQAAVVLCGEYSKSQAALPIAESYWPRCLAPVPSSCGPVRWAAAAVDNRRFAFISKGCSPLWQWQLLSLIGIKEESL